MSTDTIPPVEPKSPDLTNNPPVQTSNEFVMPPEVARRFLTTPKLRMTNTLRKRAKRAIHTAVLSRAPILQELSVIGYTNDLAVVESGKLVYNLAQWPKTFDTQVAKLVKSMNMKQLLAKLRRIPAQRRQAQWAALHSEIQSVALAAEEKANVLDALLDAVQEEIALRTKP